LSCKPIEQHVERSASFTLTLNLPQNPWTLIVYIKSIWYWEERKRKKNKKNASLNSCKRKKRQGSHFCVAACCWIKNGNICVRLENLHVKKKFFFGLSPHMLPCYR
jgi:hypothetical protein